MITILAPISVLAEEAKSPAAPSAAVSAAPVITAPAAAPATAAPAAPKNVDPVLNTGDTAWMLAAAALVLLMTPGLGFFYGGMVRSKNILSTLMHSYVAMGIVAVQWAVIGYSLAFGPDAFMGLLGNTSKMMMHGLITFRTATRSMPCSRT
jgi:Amt family ammonium transporter